MWLWAQRMFVPGSYRCSSSSPANHSPPKFEPLKWSGSRRFCASGLGFQNRNDTKNLSPNGGLSPELGGCPIYSTSFLSFAINVLAKWSTREVRNPFAPQSGEFNCSRRPQPTGSVHSNAVDTAGLAGLRLQARCSIMGHPWAVQGRFDAAVARLDHVSRHRADKRIERLGANGVHHALPHLHRVQACGG